MTHVINRFQMRCSSSGAAEVNGDGDRFTILPEPSIRVPGHIERTTVAVTQAQITNVAPNLVTGRDAFFRYARNSTGARVDVREVQIPQGLYSLTSLANKIYSLIYEQHAATEDEKIFTFLYDEATNRTVVRAYAAVSIFWDSPAGPYTGTVQDLLGFPPDTVSTFQAPVLLGGYREVFSPAPPQFNAVNQYFITCPDLVVAGIPNNNSYNNVIAMVPITEPPGSVINYVPAHPLAIPCSWNSGQTISALNFSITDEQGRPTPMSGESWSVTFEVTFYQ